MTTTDPAPVMAVFCCSEHPITGALCEVILCSGHHSADGDDWTTPSRELEPTNYARRSK